MFCMQNAIDLFITLLYYLHLFQLLNVNVFVLLKHAPNKKLMLLINIIQITFHAFFESKFISKIIQKLFNKNLKTEQENLINF